MYIAAIIGRCKVGVVDHDYSPGLVHPVWMMAKGEKRNIITPVSVEHDH